MGKLIVKSCEDFTAELASKAAVPGGGGAAALIGSAGASLCAMAGNLTVGKKKFADVEEEIKSIVEEAQKLREKLNQLVDEDAEAFEPLSKAYSMSKDDPNYDEVMHKVTIDACKAPLMIMDCSCKTIDLASELMNKCSRLVISDVGCGAISAKAALKAAALNVFVNTRTMKDRAEAQKMDNEVNEMLAVYETKAEEVYQSVLKELRK